MYSHFSMRYDEGAKMTHSSKTKGVVEKKDRVRVDYLVAGHTDREVYSCT